jgi:hypothetical protein
MEGNTPRVKVEGGTGFKVKWRHGTVYQRTAAGIASDCRNRWRSRKRELKAPPETPAEGELAKDPKKESAYAGEALLKRTQVQITW